MSKHEITPLDLMAYVDGKLPPKRRQVIELWLKEHPETWQKMQLDSHVKKAIHMAYDEVLNESIPPRLLAALDHESALDKALTKIRESMTNMRPAMVGGMCALFLAIGWGLGHQPASVQVASNSQNADFWAFQAQPIEGQVESQPVSLNTQGSTPQTSVFSPENTVENAQPLNWLTQKVGLEVQAPDLSVHGYQLQQRRMVTVRGEQAIQFIYKQPSGEPMALFIKARAPQQTPVLYHNQDKQTSAAYWEDGPLTYALTGRGVSQGLSQQIASTVKKSVAKPEQSVAANLNAAPQQPNNQQELIIENMPLEPAPQTSPRPSVPQAPAVMSPEL